MKALTWHGKGDMRCETRARSRRSSIRATPSSRSRPAPSAAPTCTSIDGVIPDDGEAATCSATRPWARWSRSARENKTAQGRRPRRRPVHHLLRRVLLLQARLLSPAASAPTRTRRRPRSCGAIRRPACSATRICSAAMPAGRRNICACPIADVGPIKVPDGPERRAGAVPLRHLPDRLHGRRFLQHPGRRHDRDLGLRPGRTVRDPERLPARRRARDRHRHGAGAAGAGARRPAPRRSIS